MEKKEPYVTDNDDEPGDTIYHIVAEETSRKYSIEIPGMVYHLGLSSFEYALYGIYRFTALRWSRCYKSLDTLAQESGMSRPSVIKARKELEARGLIKTETVRAGESFRLETTVIDIWKQNLSYPEFPQSKY